MSAVRHIRGDVRPHAVRFAVHSATLGRRMSPQRTRILQKRWPTIRWRAGRATDGAADSSLSARQRFHTDPRFRALAQAARTSMTPGSPAISLCSSYYCPGPSVSAFPEAPCTPCVADEPQFRDDRGLVGLRRGDKVLVSDGTSLCAFEGADASMMAVRTVQS